MDRRTFVSTVTALGAGATGLVLDATPAAATPATGPCAPVRIGTWGASPYRLAGTSFGGRTARFVIHTSVGGTSPRVRLSNTAGTGPVTIDRAHLGQHAGDGAVSPGTNRPLTFGGATAVTLAAGAEAISDPVDLTVGSQADLAISVYAAATIADVTGHSIAAQRSYLSTPGDHAADEAATAFTTPISSWYLIDEVTVEANQGATLVCVGDSITDGVGSGSGTNQRWPDQLAGRLLAAAGPYQGIGVLNEGIAGNRLIYDSGSPNSQARLPRDVLSHPGVYAVVLLEGINDIAIGRAHSAGELIAAYRQVRARLSVHGIRFICATITPWLGSASYSDEKEAIRETANEAIREGGYFDGVVDFDLAVRDPDDPHRMLAAYDSGGGVHPNAAGYRAMAESVPLDLLCPNPSTAPVPNEIGG